MVLSSGRSPENVHPPDNGETDEELEARTRKVKVSSSVDHRVEHPMGELSFRMRIKGKLSGCDSSEVFTSSLEEKVIFLLEKEGGEWKIISRW